MAAIAITSCDEETKLMGNSLTENIDKFNIVTDTFDVATRSVKTDSILARGSYTYLGKIKDPETGTYITCDYMTQFSILEEEAGSIFPSKETVMGVDAQGQPIADSCHVYIQVSSFQGDSLAAMKVNVRELNAPIVSKDMYYSGFDPELKGFVRTDQGAVNQSRVYSVIDLMESDSVRNAHKTGYYFAIKVPLNKEYTDKDGRTYNNYGTYLMRKYYEDPSAFKNANAFVYKVCPGFYFKSVDGQDLMCEVIFSQLKVFYHYELNSTTVVTNTVFSSTQEVMRSTHITNDPAKIEKLVSIDTCTYLKTPAGIMTEVTLPIEDIKMRKGQNGKTHENDTITSAKLAFHRMRDLSDLSEIVLEQPTNLLLIERDSLYSFFENNGSVNNISSYLATYSSTQRTYTFNNLSNLVNRMWANRNKTANWNKAILVPVQAITSTSTYTYTSTQLATVSNEMSITSARLVGGKNNKHAPVRMSIIYNSNE